MLTQKHLLEQMQIIQERELMPLKEFQAEFKQALTDAGYDSREKIINLVQEIKQEIAEEKQLKRQ